MGKEAQEIGKVYLHVSNSGVNIRVLDKVGPTLEIQSMSFGNLIQTTEIHTTRKGLTKLRDMLDEALKHDFSEESSIPAYPPRWQDKDYVEPATLVSGGIAIFDASSEDFDASSEDQVKGPDPQQKS